MPGREPPSDEEIDRRRRAGRWLRRERDDRRLHQTVVAARLGVGQQTYSRYERGELPVSEDYVTPIAELFELEEAVVWRGLELKLPAEFRQDSTAAAWSLRQLPDEEAIALAEELFPEVMRRFSGDKPPDAPPFRSGSVNRRTRDTRPGETRRDTDHGEESAV